MGFFQKIFGGGGKQGGGKLGELLQTLTTDLNLDANQASQFKSAFMAFREKRKEIKSAGGDRSQIQAARQQVNTQLMGLLTDQQKQTFTANAAKYDGILQQGQE